MEDVLFGVGRWGCDRGFCFAMLFPSSLSSLITAARTFGLSLTYCPWELWGRSGFFPLSLPFSGQVRDMCPSLRQRKHLPSFMRRVRSLSDSFPVVHMASTSMASGSLCFFGGGAFWYPCILLALVEICPGPPLGPRLSLRSCHLWTVFLDGFIPFFESGR